MCRGSKIEIRSTMLSKTKPRSSAWLQVWSASSSVTATAGRRQHISRCGRVSADGIVGEFFRQCSSVSFVLLLTVREDQIRWNVANANRSNHAKSIVRLGCPAAEALQALFQVALEDLLPPIMMPVIGAVRAREISYGLGFHGGGGLKGGKVRVSLRNGRRCSPASGPSRTAVPWMSRRLASPRRQGTRFCVFCSASRSDAFPPVP